MVFMPAPKKLQKVKKQDHLFAPGIVENL